MQSRSRWDFFDMQIEVQTKVGEMKFFFFSFLNNNKKKSQGWYCHDILL